MVDHIRTLVLKPSAAKTATGSETGYVLVPRGVVAAVFLIDITVVSGTSPTLNARIQRGIQAIGASTVIGDSTAGSIVWDDFATFAQATATGQQRIAVVQGSNDVAAVVSGSLAASTVKNGPIGPLLRVQYTIGGTNPSFTFSVIGQFS